VDWSSRSCGHSHWFKKCSGDDEDFIHYGTHFQSGFFAEKRLFDSIRFFGQKGLGIQERLRFQQNLHVEERLRFHQRFFLLDRQAHENRSQRFVQEFVQQNAERPHLQNHYRS